MISLFYFLFVLLLVFLASFLLFKLIKHFNSKPKPVKTKLKPPKSWPPPPSPKGIITSRSSGTYQNKSNRPRRERDDEDGLDAVDIIIATEMINDILVSTSKNEEPSISGGNFGGAGASGSFGGSCSSGYCDEPSKSSDSYTNQGYSSSSSSSSSSSWGGGSSSCSDSSDCGGGSSND